MTLFSCKKAAKKHIGFCPIRIWVNVDQDANDVTGHQAHRLTFGKEKSLQRQTWKVDQDLEKGNSWISVLLVPAKHLAYQPNLSLQFEMPIRSYEQCPAVHFWQQFHLWHQLCFHWSWCSLFPSTGSNSRKTFTHTHGE